MFSRTALGVSLLLVGLANAGAASAQPVNDAFGAGTPIVGLPFSDATTTIDATADATDPTGCFGFTDHTVWYTITPGFDGMIAVDTFGSNFDTTLAVVTGLPGAFLTLACNNNFNNSSFQSSLNFDVSASETYAIMVSSFDSKPGGDLALRVDETRVPPNDHFVSATVITELPFDDAFNSGLATPEATDPSPCLPLQHTVWYTFTPTEDIEILATVTSRFGARRVSVFTGSPGNFSTVLDCNINATFDADAGVTYLLLSHPDHP